MTQAEVDKQKAVVTKSVFTFPSGRMKPSQLDPLIPSPQMTLAHGLVFRTLSNANVQAHPMISLTDLEIQKGLILGELQPGDDGALH